MRVGPTWTAESASLFLVREPEELDKHQKKLDRKLPAAKWRGLCVDTPSWKCFRESTT